jgi:hypothetical protein
MVMVVLDLQMLEAAVAVLLGIILLVLKQVEQEALVL